MYNVSVVIPVYRVERFIERCARSLFEQTLDRIEYIFINDCTDDKSIDILYSILNDYPNRVDDIRIINMPINSGQAAVREVGIKQATGKYIIHCDSDDWLDKDAYRKLYDKAITKDYDIVFCDYYLTDGCTHKHIKRNYSGNDIITNIIENQIWVLWGALVKKTIFSNKIVFPTKNNGEDLAIMAQIGYYSSSFSYISSPLYYYYSNPSSITNLNDSNSYLRRLYDFIDNAQLIINLLVKRENPKYNTIILLLKLYSRAKISLLTKEKKYKSVWNSVYPEINKESILFKRGIPFRSKVNYFAVKWNIYYYLNRLKG